MNIIIRATIFATLYSTMAFAQSDQNIAPKNSSVFAANGGITGTHAAVTKARQASLIEQLKIAMADGKSNADIYALIDAAIASGDVKVPDAMKTTEGEVDHATLIAAMLAKSTSVPSEEPDHLSENTNDTDATPALLTSERGYIVVNGDSLAGIAQNFYDDPEQYTRIYNANRDQISLPNKIFVGQRLLIP